MATLTIINTKENTIDFDLEIEGLDGVPNSVKFVIKTSKVDFGFKCDLKEQNKWSVIIPAIPQLEPTLYSYSIEVVIDGYFFEPIQDNINVIKSSDLYVKNIDNTTFKPTTKSLDDKIEPIVNQVNDKVKDSLSKPSLLLKNFVSNNKPMESKANIKESTTKSSEVSDIDKKVAEILNSDEGKKFNRNKTKFKKLN